MHVNNEQPYLVHVNELQSDIVCDSNFNKQINKQKLLFHHMRIVSLMTVY